MRKHCRKKHAGLSREEFLSGFRKEDRLRAGLWDAPTSIHEMLSEIDERKLKFVQ